MDYEGVFVASSKSEIVKENIAYMARKGRFWLIYGALAPVVLLGLQLYTRSMLKHSTKRPANNWAWLFVFILAAILETTLVVWGIPWLMKRVARGITASAKPQNSLYESPLEQTAAPGGRVPGAHMFIGQQVSPVVSWAALGFVYGFMTRTIWYSLPFYLVGYIYLIWFWLTMNARFDKLGAELGAIVAEPARD
ncbi:MAG: hypothetical protein ACYC99_05120 [Candidatus Geothermincolia bacterium]